MKTAGGLPLLASSLNAFWPRAATAAMFSWVIFQSASDVLVYFFRYPKSWFGVYVALWTWRNRFLVDSMCSGRTLEAMARPAVSIVEVSKGMFPSSKMVNVLFLRFHQGQSGLLWL